MQFEFRSFSAPQIFEIIQISNPREARLYGKWNFLDAPLQKNEARAATQTFLQGVWNRSSISTLGRIRT